MTKERFILPQTAALALRARRALPTVSIEGRLTGVTTAPRGVIDHLSFPHIIKRILDYATSTVLLSFCFTNKSYCRFCNTYFGRHLVVRGLRGNNPPLAIESYRGPLLGFPQSSLDYLGLKKRIHQNRKFFRHCRIIDVVGTTGPGSPGALTSVLSNLKALRFLPKYGRYSRRVLKYSVATVIVFGVFPLFTTNLGTYRGNGPAVPRSAIKHVWNVTGLEHAPRSGEFLFFRQRATVVLHFRNYDDTKAAPWDGLYLLGESIRYALKENATTTVTIVDLDLVSLSALNFEDFPVDHPQERHRRIIEQLGVLGKRVSFLTGDEYCTQFGQTQYRIETCEKVW